MPTIRMAPVSQLFLFDAYLITNEAHESMIIIYMWLDSFPIRGITKMAAHDFV